MINIFVFLLAVAGLGVSYYIYFSKKKNKVMICHFGGDCSNVVNSKYNNIFGIPNEFSGMAYYSVVAVLVVLFMAGVVGIGSITIYSILITLGAVGVLFSTYFTYIQGVVLKDWCQYCLASAAISLLIFVIEVLP